ncbi:hypothetical protein TNCV_2597601 [Trichonephila clavipes]|nr:hypothetical protein TNCV_2597601 [Trichonephila clavipes]
MTRTPELAHRSLDFHKRGRASASISRSTWRVFNGTSTPTDDSTEITLVFKTAWLLQPRTATAGSDVVQSGRPIFDDFFQHLWPYIGNNTANVVFQMVKRLWLIRIDQ